MASSSSKHCFLSFFSLFIFISLIATALAKGGCIVGDILYQSGDSIGVIGYECMNETSWEGTESICGDDGEVYTEEITSTCYYSVPYCVQCGDGDSMGDTLCLSSPEVPEYCDTYRDGCLVGDIMYNSGDSVGVNGYKCLNETSWEGTESFCDDGEVYTVEITSACYSSVPYCVQCGDGDSMGDALCLSSPEVPEYCDRPCSDCETNSIEDEKSTIWEATLYAVLSKIYSL